MAQQEERAEARLRYDEGRRALDVFLASFQGITAPQVAEMSKAIQGQGSAYGFAKNTLALISVRELLAYEPEVERDLLRLKLTAILKSIYTRRLAMQQQMEQLIEAMTPQATVPLPPQVLQARRNAVARDALLREFGAMTSAQIGENAGSRSPNRAALAHRWKSDGRIFAVPHQGTNYFPGFQFKEDGQPLELIAQILGILGSKREPWELALWFTANNGWLAGRRPVDLLSEEPGAVIVAAEREAENQFF
jgi:hypothetical protein